MIYSKQNPPIPGQLIEIDIVWVSKCCGSRLVGFYHHGDQDSLYLSDRPQDGHVEQISWDAGIVRASTRYQEICIDP